MFIFGLLIGIIFAWFIVPDPPTWVVAGKRYVWRQIRKRVYGY